MSDDWARERAESVVGWLSEVRAVRIRPTYYGLTPDQVDSMTDEEVHAHLGRWVEENYDLVAFGPGGPNRGGDAF